MFPFVPTGVQTCFSHQCQELVSLRLLSLPQHTGGCIPSPAIVQQSDMCSTTRLWALRHQMSYTRVCKPSLSPSSCSGMERGVRERWQPWLTMGSAESAWPIMPRSEVSSEERGDEASFLNLIYCSASVISNLFISADMTTLPPHTPTPHPTPYPTRSRTVLDVFKSNDDIHEPLMVSTPQDTDRICDGPLRRRHLAVPKCL